MGSADDGHAPLLQGFGDFRNGGAKLPLPVPAAVAAHEGDKLQRLFPIARKGSLPLGEIIAVNGVSAFCHRIDKNIPIVWHICPKCPGPRRAKSVARSRGYPR